MSSRKVAVIFGSKYGLSDKIGKTEKQIREMYGRSYSVKVMDTLIGDMKKNGEIKEEPKIKKVKKDKEGGE
jgi:hypothetical protein